MSDKELKKLGFMCGVEIHQQIKTSLKLFCRCPTGLYSKKHDAEILRHMRPTLSEMGTYDGCALMEYKTKKEILYLLKKESVCTYEMDDTPPFPINEQALDIAIEIALLLNCKIVDEIHIARKQYLDGSIPTGFQRTAIIGIDGYVEMEDKKVRIRQISIEEDSCREVDDKGHIIKFRTDRLGMPLIEVVTEPDFETPKAASLGVKAIGRLLRATGKVRRGIGSVRQDVNVSITGGSRVEIKGVPRYQLIPDLTRIEGFRQKALLDLKQEFKKRGITKDSLETYEIDITKEISNTRSDILRKAIENKQNIRGIKIEKISGLLNWNTQPGMSFVSELSGRVSVIACLDNLPNIFHTDSFPDYVGSHKDLRRIINMFNATDNDVVVIMWGSLEDTKTACSEIVARIIDAMDGVPNETRQHKTGGLTYFERVLPGAERMYPDTDHPPIRIKKERVENIRSLLPEKTIEVERRFQKYGLQNDVIENLSLSSYKNLVDYLSDKNINMKILGRMLGHLVLPFEKKGINFSKIDKDQWALLIKNCEKMKIKAKNYKNILLKVVNSKTCDIAGIIAYFAEKEAN